MGNDSGRTVRCRNIDCEYEEFPADRLSFRPGVYGLVVNCGRLLFAFYPHLGSYTLPGGGANPDETLEEALVREIKEETGLAVRVGRLLHFAQEFFVHPAPSRPCNCLSFFYLCELVGDDDIPETVEHPDFPDAGACWIDIDQLSEFDIHPFVRDLVLQFVESLGDDGCRCRWHRCSRYIAG